MQKKMMREVKPGSPWRPGVQKEKDGCNFAVEIPEGAEASLLLYKKGKAEAAEEIPIPFSMRIGRMGAVYLPGLKTENYEYNYKINGQICQDPYAVSVVGRKNFGKPEDLEHPHKVRCAFPEPEEFDWEDTPAPEISYSNMILYKIHVRGYTKQAGTKIKKKGTFQGLTEMIPYWKELGINALELMPAYEFWEVLPYQMRDREEKEMVVERTEHQKINYWGYTEGFYFAPKSAYCAGKYPQSEFKELVRALHKEGIACIMEFYFPASVPPLRVLEVLRYWKTEYRVDGFHLVGEGIPSDLLSRDPMLAGTKLMMTNFDPGQTLATGSEDKTLAEYNMGFLQDMRRFLKSDEDTLQGAAYRIKRNPENCGVINYMACQDGFTMMDMVSYDYKHNEDNGEDNQDGSSYNYSWNCGVEGPSRKISVRQMRERQIKNAFLMVLLSQGTPMIYGGDEFGNSQMGNNNAYCQDNPVGWVNWNAEKKNTCLRDFVKQAVAFRRAHPILHMKEELKGMDYQAYGCPDMSYHSQRAWYTSFDNTCRVLGIMYCGAYAKRENQEKDDDIYVAYNFHWEPRELALPNLPEEMKWKKVIDTSDPSGTGIYMEKEAEELENQRVLTVQPRSIVVLLSRQERVKDASMASF